MERTTGLGLAGTLVAAALVLGSAGPASGQDESKCSSAKYKAAGKYVQSQAGCRAKALARGKAVDPDCQPEAAEPFAKGFLKAEGKADCLTTGDEAAIQALADAFVADLIDALQPPRCCSNNPTCFWVNDEGACTARNGTLGAPGSVCDGSTDCTAPPATPGDCCQDFNSGGTTVACAIGLSTSSCVTLGGLSFPSTVCTPEGVCQ
jgi:hypothetical protein